jgi:predicted DNA binding CopG/RHH family protein
MYLEPPLIWQQPIIEKLWEKHRVEPGEVEEVFFDDRPHFKRHGEVYHAYGQTVTGALPLRGLPLQGRGQGQAHYGLRDDGQAEKILPTGERRELMAKAVKSKRKRKKELPDMTGWSEEQIAEFWETHESTEYLDQMEDVEVELKIPQDYRVISLRMEAKDIERTKRLARRKGLPYTVLLRMWIKEKLEEAGAA